MHNLFNYLYKVFVILRMLKLYQIYFQMIKKASSNMQLCGQILSQSQCATETETERETDKERGKRKGGRDRLVVDLARRLPCTYTLN